jgi:hypothetical protein
MIGRRRAFPEEGAAVPACEMARRLARVARGLVEDHAGRWWVLARGGHYRQVL